MAYLRLEWAKKLFLRFSWPPANPRKYAASIISHNTELVGCSFPFFLQNICWQGFTIYQSPENKISSHTGNKAMTGVVPVLLWFQPFLLAKKIFYYKASCVEKTQLSPNRIYYAVTKSSQLKSKCSTPYLLISSSKWGFWTSLLPTLKPNSCMFLISNLLTLQKL